MIVISGWIGCPEKFNNNNNNDNNEWKNEWILWYEETCKEGQVKKILNSIFFEEQKVSVVKVVQAVDFRKNNITKIEEKEYYEKKKM